MKIQKTQTIKDLIKIRLMMMVSKLSRRGDEIEEIWCHNNTVFDDMVKYKYFYMIIDLN